MDHNRLFKELLRTFFFDFLELFFPEVAEYIEPNSAEFLDKELFGDLVAGERHEVDLLAKHDSVGWRRSSWSMSRRKLRRGKTSPSECSAISRV